jgi:hypothetical protein
LLRTLTAAVGAPPVALNICTRVGLIASVAADGADTV